MLKIAVCDDDIVITAKIETLLENILKRNLIEVDTIDVFNSSRNFLNYVKKNNEYDLIYLDIEMPEVDGIKLAEKIREENRDVLFIYISSYENYFVDMIKVTPFRFIRKPIDDRQFTEDLNAACKEIMERAAYFEYTYNKVTYRVLIKDIIYFESFGRNIHIITTKEIRRYVGKLNQVEKQLKLLKSQFLRIHQSFLVNRNLIVEINFDNLIMSNGESLRISYDRRKQIRRSYLNTEE